MDIPLVFSEWSFITGTNMQRNAYNESFLPITTDYYLFLSGTPFRAINSGEFIEDQIYNWTYSDEQKAKDSWIGSGNPYASLPRMVMLTYKVPDSITTFVALTLMPQQGQAYLRLLLFWGATPTKVGTPL